VWCRARRPGFLQIPAAPRSCAADATRLPVGPADVAISLGTPVTAVGIRVRAVRPLHSTGKQCREEEACGEQQSMTLKTET
jgi:hypothetical protein